MIQLTTAAAGGHTPRVISPTRSCPPPWRHTHTNQGATPIHFQEATPTSGSLPVVGINPQVTSGRTSGSVSGPLPVSEIRSRACWQRVDRSLERKSACTLEPASTGLAEVHKWSLTAQGRQKSDYTSTQGQLRAVRGITIRTNRRTSNLRHHRSTE